MRCKHCGKQIKSYNNYRGETDWTHEDQMVGRWCWLKSAAPEDEMVGGSPLTPGPHAAATYPVDGG